MDKRKKQRGEFRPDLYDRLQEVFLEVPPLRDRPDDVPLLIQHFMNVYTARHGRTRPPDLTPEAWRLIRLYAWPGNVRELEHAVSRAVVLGTPSLIGVRDLALSQTLFPDMLSERQQEAVRIACRDGVVRRGDLTRRFGVSPESARRDLLALAKAGILDRRGRGRGARYTWPDAG